MVTFFSNPPGSFTAENVYRIHRAKIAFSLTPLLVFHFAHTKWYLFSLFTFRLIAIMTAAAPTSTTLADYFREEANDANRNQHVPVAALFDPAANNNRTHADLISAVVQHPDNMCILRVSKTGAVEVLHHIRRMPTPITGGGALAGTVLALSGDVDPDLRSATAVTFDVDHNRRGRNRRPLAYIDVFVDDFLGLAQGQSTRRNRVRRALLHQFDAVFRPLEAHEGPRQEPVSVKKLLKGDACWATTKVILGWLVDSVRGTIELPPHRAERLLELISSFQERKRCSIKSWRQLIGELRSMTVALPGW